MKKIFVLFLAFICTCNFACDILGAAASDRAVIDYGDFFEAVRTENTALVKDFLDHGTDIEAKNKFGSTPLLKACMLGCEIVARLLLERGANIEAKDCGGDTPLINACWRGHERIVSLLLEKGADTEATNNKGVTAAEVATRGGFVNLAELITSWPAEEDIKEPGID